jgi:thioredoxin 1
LKLSPTERRAFYCAAVTFGAARASNGVYGVNKERALMGANAKTLTTDNFQAEVLNAQEPVLVDFWAPICPPCRQIAPMIEQLAVENLGSASVGKVDVSDHPQLAVQYGITSIPTLLFFHEGQPVQKIVGTGKPKSAIQSILDELKK